ncbi:Ribosome maturation factor RimP [Enhygromyxa salina]|uniref:Ribosome maturation factor RimP n=1 Tax=Enhygromyxa salina TaxID=215803 RepID=A0A2S9XCJ7_9BACT|nr:ribosome maturation factor RimP [Enhygromyxa salina]PRP90577.1 Ribosome maturation factor RimP [Enhygromyxa salina]
MNPTQNSPAYTAATASKGGGSGGVGERAAGRHASAEAVLTRAVEPVVEDMGFELLRLEWLASGKRRVMRIYLDHADGVSIAECSRMSRIIGNTLDASEAAAGQGADTAQAPDPALVALLTHPYTLEVSSPGVDRPLARRRHFAAQVGARVKIETWAPLPPEFGGSEAGSGERKFHGRVVAVEEDPAAPDDQRSGVVVVHDHERDRTLRIPLPRIRRANLVWEG